MANNVPKNDDDAFETYAKTYLNEVIRRKIELVVGDHQTEILKFRKKWKIRPQGYKTNRSRNAWYKKRLRRYKRQSQIVYEHIGEVEIDVNRFYLVKPPQRLPQKRESRTIKIGKSFVYYFRQRVLELAAKINLDPTWDSVLENYILTNIVDMRYLPYAGIAISKRYFFSHDNKDMGNKVCLTFGPNTRLKDIQLIWKNQVEPIFPSLTGYMKNPPRKRRKE